MKNKILLFLIVISSLFLNATELKREGWNLISVCQDMNRSDIDMTGIQQIQSLDGKNIYTGSNARFSSLNTLVAGYGYWVKGAIGTNFNSGISTQKVEIPLTREGWNIVGMCEDKLRDLVSMTGIQQIQSLDGKNIYTGSNARFSSLNTLVAGYGYWVKGTIGTTFLSKDGISIPSTYQYPVYNNELKNGTERVVVTATLNEYTLKFFSNEDVSITGQELQKSLIVSINGNETPEIPIASTYKNKTLVVGVYDSTDKLIAVSDIKVVSNDDFPLVIPITIDNTSPTNHPPVLTPIPNQTMNTNTLTLDVNATDADNDTITFDVNSSDPASVTASIIGNQLTLTRLTSSTGTFTITVKATDDKGASDSKSFTVTLANNNTDALSIGTMPSALITPNGGEVWTYDHNETINWNMSIDGSSVSLYILHDNPDNLKTFNGDVSTLLSSMNWYQIGSSVPNTGSYEVNPRILNGTGDAYVILIVSNQSGEWDISDNTFTLVDPSGNGGDTNSTPISEEIMNTFAGKTFYITYINENSVGIIEEIIFDENLSKLTWEEIRGRSESGSDSIRVEGNRLYVGNNEYHEYIEQVENYLLTHDYEQDSNGSWVQRDTTRLYFNLNDAESYLATLNGGNPPAIDLPNGYSYRAINNLGTEVETAVEIEGNSYTLQLYSDINISANDQANHVGIMISVNGQTALLQIQNSYETHDVVLAVYDVTGQLVAVSSETTVNGNTPISLTF